MKIVHFFEDLLLVVGLYVSSIFHRMTKWSITSKKNLTNNAAKLILAPVFQQILLDEKELSFCHRLWFSNLYIFVNLRYFKLIILIGKISLKYQRFAPSGCKDIGISRFEFLAKTLFLCHFLECKVVFEDLSLVGRSVRSVFQNNCCISTDKYKSTDDKEYFSNVA